MLCRALTKKGIPCKLRVKNNGYCWRHISKQIKKKQIGPKMFEIKGNLFCANSSLAHCVSQDLKMGKGIAKQFRNKFDKVNELSKQNIKKGDVAILKIDERYIYYLVTKEKFWHKPNYLDLENSLFKMKEHCVKNYVKLLSMPLIGCGLDKLEWKKVETMIKKIFKDSDIEINIYKQ